MEFWHQLTTTPSLLIGPVSIGAVFSGIIAWLVARNNQRGTSSDVDRKILAERDFTDRKIFHEKDSAISERAWVDYGLRRDIYLQFAEQVSCLFSSHSISEPVIPGATIPNKTTFHQVARKIRIVGSDEVVRALNALTSSIISPNDEGESARMYSQLMNAIRKDIRTLNETPAIGTSLDESAFPIEG